MISYEVNQADLQRVTKALKGMEKKAPRVIKNAVNHTAKIARKELYAGVSKGYTVKSGGFNKRVKIENATNSKLYAIIKAADRTMTIGRFKTSAPKKGAKADIVKKGLKEIVGSHHIHAFKLKGGAAGGLIAQRKGPERNPIKILRSNSVPKMLEMVYKGERGTRKALDPVIKQTLHDEIAKEIAKIKA